jgi:predicted Zn-dependent protease
MFSWSFRGRFERKRYFALLLSLAMVGNIAPFSMELYAKAAQATPLSGQVVYGRATTARRGLSSPASVLARIEAANQVPVGAVQGIQVIQSSDLNASTNGRTIEVTSALFDRLTTDDEQAFVISHELSHILLNHIQKTEFRRVGLSLLDSYFVQRYASQNPLAQMAGALGVSLADKRGSRTYEYQADDLGVQLMTKAGYDPRGALGVFRVLKAAAGNNRTPGFLMDHPITDDRIRALVNKYKLS